MNFAFLVLLLANKGSTTLDWRQGYEIWLEMGRNDNEDDVVVNGTKIARELLRHFLRRLNPLERSLALRAWFRVSVLLFFGWIGIHQTDVVIFPPRSLKAIFVKERELMKEGFGESFKDENKFLHLNLRKASERKVSEAHQLSCRKNGQKFVLKVSLTNLSRHLVKNLPSLDVKLSFIV